MPNVYGSHHSSKVANATSTVSSVASTSPSSGLGEELLEMALASTRQPGLVDDVGVELARDVPADAERTAAAVVVPDARGDDATRSGDPRHLPQPADRVAHEVDDQLGQGGVVRVVGEGEVLRGPGAYVDLGQPGAQCGDERW